MPATDNDTLIKVSSEAADTFVNHYYQAINNRSSLLPFYVNSSSRYALPADISINGAIVATPADYSQLLEGQGKEAHYEIESFDAHPVNPSFQYGAPETIYDNARVEKNGGKTSIAVTIMGRLQLGRGREAPQTMFNETIMLVPNWDAMVKNPPRGMKRWLILSQNFRAL
ncbi:nuclear transport factor 2 domain-containing protein [Dactylonectria estremocensis]|uniref:Nuclear transport factor 2 domain-containing protein n=1 Tax=Dactylonectria estremocensis TaxID=1079267 RepID=A0A9P9F473_9HYPO|nr:nuclear transport factor 2 domain-containing protein [Dactylonectria estremocensis]